MKDVLIYSKIYHSTFYILFEILRCARAAPALTQDDRGRRPLKRCPARPQDDGGGSRALRHSLSVPARYAARGRNKISIALNKYSKKGKITLFPFFPYEHTDGGECAARFNKREPLYARRRGEKPPPARRVILRAARMAGFPLPHDFFFRQHERKSVNLILPSRQDFREP